jgi:3-isopropylmalate/(R)-2-methylmalate dehydratase large subunit
MFLRCTAREEKRRLQNQLNAERTATRSNNMPARTLFDKIWDAHVVAEQPDAPSILYVDLHLVHEVTSPQAFQDLRERGLKVRRPDKTVATVDHSVPTTNRGLPIMDALAAKQVDLMYQNARDFGIRIYDLSSSRQGIVHIIGPELGLTQPGLTIVCGDSHTSTHGAFGALAFGIGTSEVAHVLASQCLLQRRPKTFNVRVDGSLGRGITAKDVILALIAKIGVDGGTGHVIEYSGPAIRALGMEGRMTICNMSIEAGARAGMVAPDDVTFEYVAGREFAPKGDTWDKALARWKALPTDESAGFDKTATLDATVLEPMITYGTNPGMGLPVTARVPDPDQVADRSEKAALAKALTYMDLTPGASLLGHPVDVVFIGSCTNSRISDLRLAAQLLKGKRVAPNVRVLVVPGSQQIKRQAEAEGLHEIFRASGAEWREAGCSMCIAMNGDEVGAGKFCVSTSNRNFEGRQGKGARTFLASPLTAAASAINGAVADPRELLN